MECTTDTSLRLPPGPVTTGCLPTRDLMGSEVQMSHPCARAILAATTTPEVENPSNKSLTRTLT